jgi:hypothetical protein
MRVRLNGQQADRFIVESKGGGSGRSTIGAADGSRSIPLRTKLSTSGAARRVATSGAARRAGTASDRPASLPDASWSVTVRTVCLTQFHRIVRYGNGM